MGNCFIFSLNQSSWLVYQLLSWAFGDGSNTATTTATTAATTTAAVTAGADQLAQGATAADLGGTGLDLLMKIMGFH